MKLQPIHQLGVRSTEPMFFENGMDSIECEIYYAIRNSQQSGGSVRPLKIVSRAAGGKRTRPALVTSPKKPEGSAKQSALRSCLREAKRGLQSTPVIVAQTHNQRPRRRPPLLALRSSFSELPLVRATDSFDDESYLSAPKTTNELPEASSTQEQRGVRFGSCVHTITIPSIDDYPDEIKASLWMSRRERRRSQKAVARQEEREEEAQEAAVVGKEQNEAEPMQRDADSSSPTTACDSSLWFI